MARGSGRGLEKKREQRTEGRPSRPCRNVGASGLIPSTVGGQWRVLMERAWFIFSEAHPACGGEGWRLQPASRWEVMAVRGGSGRRAAVLDHSMWGGH